MPNKNDYSGKPPSSMQSQRGGTPRNVGSPPPDVPPQTYSGAPRTQSAPSRGAAGDHTRPGMWAPQPNARPHEGDGKMAKKNNINGPQKPTGTVVPERRGMKDHAGDGGVPGRVGQSINVPGDAFSIHPSPMEGYKPPGRASKP